MRNYKRKRIGHGNLYIAIDKQLGLARIGFSTNLYTTQANLARNWQIVVSYESEHAGILDKRITNMLASERSINYQSSKSYKLDSYRVRKLIETLQIEIDFPISTNHDLCPCLICGKIMEIEYRSKMNLVKLLDIWENSRYCDDCKPTNCIICDARIISDEVTCSIRCETLYRAKKLWELSKSNKKDNKGKKSWKKLKED